MEATLNKVRNATVTKLADLEFSVTVGKMSFDVTLNEAKAAVERNGGALAKRDEVKTYDVRFELLLDHADMGDLFNPLLSAAEKLAKLTNGVVYESDNGVFQ